MSEIESVPLTHIPYAVANWPEGRGLHRAVVRVDASAEAVRVHLPWRRRDHDPERKRIIVTDAADRQIANLAVLRMDRESADLVFHADAPGEYHVYYYPHEVQTRFGWYQKDYLPPVATADLAWLRHVGTHGQVFPQAALLRFEARSEFDRFDPMEVVATAAEMQALLAAHPEPYLLFPEDRQYPIRMREDLPYYWIKRGPSAQFTGTACRNEYYAFQIGVYASGEPVEEIAIDFGDLHSGDAVIPAAAFTCFNLGGVDWMGRPFTKTVSVSQGNVQALWCGIDIPENAAPGLYEGTLTIRPKNVPASTVQLSIEITDEVLADRGDGEPWRHSRLRWLNSTLGDDDDVVEPFTPLEVTGRTVRCLDRAVTFGEGLLPASITSNGAELLAAPMSFTINDAVVTGEPCLVKQTPGAVEWETDGQPGPLSVRSHVRMECDGYLRFTLTVRAAEQTNVRDIRLEIPLRRETATYLVGGGRKGGFRPAEHTWRWADAAGSDGFLGGEPYYDSYWIGGVDAGLQCELRGADYCGPMVNLYWRIGQLQPPAAWHNEGRGKTTFTEEGDIVLVRTSSGSRALQTGEELTFEFALLITPCKPLDPPKHFDERYFHSSTPVKEAVEAGANIINVHHAGPMNPYINYPFLANEKLSAYVREAHGNGVQVKIYYTVRELTNRIIEMWALRSLGHEILAPGPGGGYLWLRQHFGDDYTSAWYDHMDGDVSNAVVNSGASRWYNYYLEGLAWLLQHIEIDGLYLDDVSYDRHIIKRMRKIMNRVRPGCLIDLHSCEEFSISPANQYLEFFPFIDSLWFGELFDYDAAPDYWLTEISGIPYGLMGDMLQDGGNRWRGMVYGMTARFPHGEQADPRPMWKVWDDFGIDQAEMRGYWHPACPVRPDRDDVKATAYLRDGKALIALASWAPEPVMVRLQIDWQALGIAPAALVAPEVENFQPSASFERDEAISVEPGKGWVLIVG
ncbi:MAG: glycoside hydrolase domain-containing protein [Armatimonadota bacterium]